MKQRLPQFLLLLVLCLGLSAQVTSQREIDSLDRASQFVGWVDSHKLPWRTFVVSGLPDAEYRLLSRNQTSGARSQITHLPAGWAHPKGYHRTNEEIFVLEGDLTFGDKSMTKYSYAYYPAGYVHGPAVSDHGATILQWWDAEPDFVEAETSRADARVGEVVEGWNFYDQPWTSNEDFPRWADFPPPPDMRLKLLRQDKETGQMTWINWFQPGYMKTLGNMGGKFWEAHPSWEEAVFLEGDLTVGECLPGRGAVEGTYTAGGYFWRPAGIRHVGPNLQTTGHVMFLHRSGKSIWADYFTECNVR